MTQPTPDVEELLRLLGPSHPVNLARRIEELERKMTSAEETQYARLAELTGLIRAEFASLRQQLSDAQAQIGDNPDVDEAVRNALSADAEADAARLEGMIDELAGVVSSVPDAPDVPDVPVPDPGQPAEVPVSDGGTDTEAQPSDNPNLPGGVGDPSDPSTAPSTGTSGSGDDVNVVESGPVDSNADGSGSPNPNETDNAGPDNSSSGQLS